MWASPEAVHTSSRSSWGSSIRLSHVWYFRGGNGRFIWGASQPTTRRHVVVHATLLAWSFSYSRWSMSLAGRVFLTGDIHTAVYLSSSTLIAPSSSIISPISIISSASIAQASPVKLLAPILVARADLTKHPAGQGRETLCFVLTSFIFKVAMRSYH